MAYPTTLPSYTSSDPSKTLDQDNHTQRHNTAQADIVALATKVGIDSSADANSLDNKVATLQSTRELVVNKSTNTSLGSSDTLYPSQKAVKAYVDATIAAAILAADQAKYKIGKIIFDTTNTNPNTYLGFGTWVAWGAGRVPVGVDSGQTEFDGNEETGGSKTNVLVAGNLPSLTGSIAFHNTVVATTLASVGGVFSAGNVNSNKYFNQGAGTAGADSIGSANFNNGGASTPVNNLQPYITVFMFKRTA